MLTISGNSTISEMRIFDHNGFHVTNVTEYLDDEDETHLIYETYTHPVMSDGLIKQTCNNLDIDRTVVTDIAMNKEGYIIFKNSVTRANNGYSISHDNEEINTTYTYNTNKDLESEVTIKKYTSIGEGMKHISTTKRKYSYFYYNNVKLLKFESSDHVSKTSTEMGKNDTNTFHVSFHNGNKKTFAKVAKGSAPQTGYKSIDEEYLYIKDKKVKGLKRAPKKISNTWYDNYGFVIKIEVQYTGEDPSLYKFNNKFFNIDGKQITPCTASKEPVYLLIRKASNGNIVCTKKVIYKNNKPYCTFGETNEITSFIDYNEKVIDPDTHSPMIRESYNSDYIDSCYDQDYITSSNKAFTYFNKKFNTVKEAADQVSLIKDRMYDTYPNIMKIIEKY